jgi:hypothetical protein
MDPVMFNSSDVREHTPRHGYPQTGESSKNDEDRAGVFCGDRVVLVTERSEVRV